MRRGLFPSKYSDRQRNGTCRCMNALPIRGGERSPRGTRRSHQKRSGFSTPPKKKRWLYPLQTLPKKRSNHRRGSQLWGKKEGKYCACSTSSKRGTSVSHRGGQDRKWGIGRGIRGYRGKGGGQLPVGGVRKNALPSRTFVFHKTR